MKIIAVIPARYSSSRFPGKALIDIKGKSMIQRVYDRVKLLGELLIDIIVATDDERIYNEVKNFGGKPVMTPSDCQSGTDRIAFVAKDLSCDLIVNVQGDEPLLEPEMVRAAVRPFLEDNSLEMSTVKKEITAREEIDNPNIVKVITDLKGDALYFSRYPVPYQRNEAAKYYKHIGLYVYKRDFLLKYTSLEPAPLEKSESLEQLRALENGYRIRVVETEYNSIGVDVPDDLDKVVSIIEGEE
ncbi:3-deoxy-manno-octulosonate cytidylyltransferase [Iocasia frigidifontis]|uniref:3-deoxy-manno-octulosonate cytidylyltransferase n=1 Tax=Iocasia fonsfrigidae TaxID=2682810 RepID=A0A8A7K9P6_9FIRM|nr:3-deoxy-manno-octulosonate cytidylyltransferase [Iocasia fonsfrigidae]QTL96815.1 3-deoxy-manno-octulosonate cytidylyltransferase [Iocasia fonsfrigidae]